MRYIDTPITVYVGWAVVMLENVHCSPTLHEGMSLVFGVQLK